MRLFLSSITLQLILAPALLAQPSSNAHYDGGPTRGIVPNAVYNVSGLDTVDLRSGGLSLQIPLASLPASPGGSSMGAGLMYNSQIYDLTGAGNDLPGNQTTHLPRGFRTSTTGGGWTYSHQYAFSEEQRPYASTTAGCVRYSGAAHFDTQIRPTP